MTLEKKPPKKTTPLTTVITMDLGGLALKHSKIPINPLNLVTVSSTVLIFQSIRGTTFFIIPQISTHHMCKAVSK